MYSAFCFLLIYVLHKFQERFLSLLRAFIDAGVLQHLHEHDADLVPDDLPDILFREGIILLLQLIVPPRNTTIGVPSSITWNFIISSLE